MSGGLRPGSRAGKRPWICRGGDGEGAERAGGGRSVREGGGEGGNRAQSDGITGICEFLGERLILARVEGESGDGEELDAVYAQCRQLQLLQAAQMAVAEPSDGNDDVDLMALRKCGRGCWMLMRGLVMIGRV